VRIQYDIDRDEATIYVGEQEHQSYDEGWTSLVMTDPAEIQLGVEGSRLVFMLIRPASKVLPSETLESST
jgi:hypothetical protein